MSDVLSHLMAPFNEALADPGTTELVVSKCGEFGVETGGEWFWFHDERLTFDHLDSIGILAAWATRQPLDVYNPRASSVLPGGLRVQIARPPAVPDGTYSLTIRKRATSFTPTLEWLDERGYFSALPQDRNWVDYWRNAVRARRTIAIAGNVGSSKTTFAEALIREIPSTERLVTIEKTAEWFLPHRNLVTMLYGSSGDAERAATQCVEDSLRQRPDRILIGELRSGGEVWAYLRALLAGHPGGITTLHAESTAGAVDALAMMMRQDRSGATMADDVLRDHIKRMVHVIVHCARDPYRVAAVEEI